ncbi:MAG: hypothetical protein CL933_00155 [Deltaproteobacteria bacterium]|nr:hypothetical protein [Deltaproteobacteria bacterium]
MARQAARVVHQARHFEHAGVEVEPEIAARHAGGGLAAGEPGEQRRLRSNCHRSGTDASSQVSGGDRIFPGGKPSAAGAAGRKPIEIQRSITPPTGDQGQSDRSKTAIRDRDSGDTGHFFRWHRELIAKKYDGSKSRRPGRPRTAADSEELVLLMARDNPRWGYTLIRGALHHLGHEIVRNNIK